MANRRWTKEQTVVYKTLHRKINIDWASWTLLKTWLW
jgi:hypothetical protein